jgi:hypothetical protein
VLGGVGLAGGLVLWLTAPSADASTSASAGAGKTTLKQGLRVTPMVTRETGGLMLGGTL